jgi:hypothetical protein
VPYVEPRDVLERGEHAEMEAATDVTPTTEHETDAHHVSEDDRRS